MGEKKKSFAGLLPLICMVLLVTVAGFCLYLVKMNSQQKDIIGRMTVRVEQFQKKYAEEKHQAEEYLKMKSAVEGRQRTSQADLDKADKELKDLQAEFNTVKTKQAGQISSLTAERDKLQKDLDDLKKRDSQYVAEAEKEQKKLADAKKDLEKKLKRSEDEVDRARTNNAQLCVIARDLLNKYKNKGVVNAITAKEPLTQVKKVELEQMTQEYADKIKELKLEKESAGK